MRACARLEAESYADEGVAAFIHAHFLPVESHIKERPAWFHRFDATWTPTVLVLDSKGAERHRIEGYLPKDEFEAQLQMGLGRVAFKEMRWPDAERMYHEVVEEFPKTSSAPEARFWRAVSRFKRTNDHAALVQAANELQKSAPESVWTKKAAHGWGIDRLTSCLRVILPRQTLSTACAALGFRAPLLCCANLQPEQRAEHPPGPRPLGSPLVQ